jgi:hypothetical protein
VFVERPLLRQTVAMRVKPAAIAAAALVAVLVGGARSGQCAFPSLAHEALFLCHAADALSGPEKEEILEYGLVLAERAVALDGASPHAHFAVFCTLGRLVEHRGVGIRTLRAIGRARHELDRTLEIAPDYVDALVAKAEMLTRLPRWLGGDPEEAERCRHRARTLRPETAPVRTAIDDLRRDA